MSHFAVLVIGNNPDELLAPYDENIEEELYVRGFVTEKEKQDFIEYYTEKNASGDIVERTENTLLTFEDLYEKYKEAWNEGRWKKNDEDMWVEYSTYNPLSKWDCYILGGRWPNLLKLKNQSGSCVIGEDTKFIEGYTDSALAEYVDLQGIGEKVHAVLYNGEWFERGEMGWWGSVHDEKDSKEWIKEVDNVIAKIPKDVLVSVYDCHI